MEYTNIAGIGLACTGCRACEQICPKKSISIVENEEGFLYPQVDEKTCVDCGLCLKKCAQAKADKEDCVPLGAYALKNKDAEELFESASGGASDVAAKAILEKNGVVFGAAYTEDLAVKHIAVENDGERYRLKSSKYVQSDSGDCYSQAKRALDRGKYVLYTGTPCQIAGLRSFLGRDYDRLYTIDLICHGVPSPLFFKKYVSYMGEKMGGRLIAYNFRSKEKRGWGTQYLAKTKTKTKTKTLALDKYGKHFMASDCYRECCYQCRYADINQRPADLTIGDFWAVDRYLPEMSSPLGVSSVLVNTQRGEELLKMMRKFAEVSPISLEAVLAKQSNLVGPTVRPDERDTFYIGIDKADFIHNIAVGIELKERIKALLPRAVITNIKRRLH